MAFDKYKTHHGILCIENMLETLDFLYLSLHLVPYDQTLEELTELNPKNVTQSVIC